MLRGLKQFNLPELEEKVLKFWAENEIFKKSVALRQAPASAKASAGRQGKKHFVFFEGPPTANGLPHIGHAETRTFKDIILRYKTMRGFYVPRRAGWDTHGLPVEIEVEKALGLKNKQEIETFGIAAFNARAKESIWKYKNEWERFSDRIGFWIDSEHPYITYANDFVESLWWVMAQIAKKGLLKKLYKVVPWCPRCQTSLSSHELAQAYKLTKDPSVYVKFKIRNKGSASTSSANKEFLLVWTTTPWTLPSNVAVAVNPKLTYTKYKVGDEYLWSYNAPPTVNGMVPEAVEQLLGKKLVGLRYEGLYPIKQQSNKATKQFYAVLSADFVQTGEGTGLVHIAPAFGEDDYRLISETWKLTTDEIPRTIDERGMVLGNLPGSGRFIKSADKDIVVDLVSRGLMYSEGSVEHDYPFCWRCSSPLIYFARTSWFIEMSKMRAKLLAANKEINWVPAHLKEGRFGEWIREVKDWAISRERYWGTPLPIWECEKCDATRVISSFADLDEFAFNRNTFFAVRHGEATHNVEGWIASGTKIEKKSELTKRGIADVEGVAKKLKKEKIDLIVASPYHRTRQTVQVLLATLGKIPVIYDDRLGEINTGVYNGKTVEEYRAIFGGRSVLEFTQTPEGGENLHEVQARMLAFLRELNAKYVGKRIVVVSHGDPLWVLEGKLNGLSDEEVLALDYIQPGNYRSLVLRNYPYDAAGNLDVHRPYVDELYLRCAKCKSRMTRVKEVADVWFDSGAMPYAQWHYPFEHKKEVDNGTLFPADYITEGIDQTRGWFYTLLAVSVLLGRGAPYKNVVSLGHVLDKNGLKMSKSKGNVVEPMAMIQKYGADVVRWYFYTVNPAGEPKRYDENDLLKTYRRFFAILYNSFVFLDTYGAKSIVEGQLSSVNVLDRWILAKLQSLIGVVTAKLDSYEMNEAARAIELFVDDLSRWYIRRSRRRFQRPEKGDYEAASATLREVLGTLSKLIAPFTPFFGEALYASMNQESNKAKKQSSVHLTDWPETDAKLSDDALVAAMEEVRKLASIGLAKRAEAGIKVRQPLAALRINKAIKQESKKASELLDILKDEVNVKEIVIDSSMAGDVELDTKITPELRNEGLFRELVRMVQELRQTADYKPGERAILSVMFPPALKAVIEARLKDFKNETSLSEVEFKKSEKFDAEISTKVEENEVWLGIRKK
ncbi:MAG: class I tRNA ligase family protein [bacterium]|nr:class I tRNA ligase family protein [bacterium]